MDDPNLQVPVAGADPLPPPSVTLASQKARETATSTPASGREQLLAELERAAAIVPSQPPLRLFVHLNPLHAYEHRHFDEAVVETARQLGAEPYPSEARFAQYLRSGRILRADIEAVLDEAGVSADSVFEGGPSHRALQSMRLRHPFEVPRDQALRWAIQETELLRRCHPSVSDESRERLRRAHPEQAVVAPREAEARALEALWQRLSVNAPLRQRAATAGRLRDAILRRTGVDTDEWVNPFLIRFCGAYVDQGISYWRFPFQDSGLYAAFRQLYHLPLGPPEAWLRGLRQELARQLERGWDAVQVTLDVLERLGCPPTRWYDLLQSELLALPGWAGMIRQLEVRPERAPVRAPAARLIDFVAVRLTLTMVASRHALGRAPRFEESEPSPVAPAPEGAQGVYEAFVMAQLLGLGPAAFTDADAVRRFRDAVAAFDAWTRRQLLQRAYERRHRVVVLDALLNHARDSRPQSEEVLAQAMFCFDEREESLRRHLEELTPNVETFGYAGSFGVPMAYHGLEDTKPSALCPPAIKPRHLVLEVLEEAGEARARPARVLVQWIGELRHWLTVGSTTAVRGSLIAGVLGIFSALSLLWHCLFPYPARRLRERLHQTLAMPRRLGRPARQTKPKPQIAGRVESSSDRGWTLTGAPRSRLSIECVGEARSEQGWQIGFTVDEMAEIVATVLSTTGAAKQLAPLFLVFGHGSSSLNNPHEAAHDCGACGGGRGGPNARAFAAMANHPRVRERLRQAHGVHIPDSTWFVGGYHDTCDDSIHYYDVDLIPKALASTYESTRGVLEQARRWNAHERCRRFEDVPHTMNVERALARVQARSVDLAQPRPEYGHATNAVCLIGRRERSRGLFLDRRAFLISYDPTLDTDGARLEALLQSAVPVGAGISLEYYFSFVDNQRHGCGTKLPHNITGLIGIMDGHASDLRTGLPWQMVEIHEPVRMLTVLEAEFDVAARVLAALPAVARLVDNEWIQLAVWSPSSGEMRRFEAGQLVPYRCETRHLPSVARSYVHYLGRSDHLECVRVEAALAARG